MYIEIVTIILSISIIFIIICIEITIFTIHIDPVTYLFVVFSFSILSLYKLQSVAYGTEQLCNITHIAHVCYYIFYVFSTIHINVIIN